MNSFNLLEHVQHFDAHNYNQNKEKEKMKEEKIQFTIFRNTCNITKRFVVILKLGTSSNKR